MTPRQAVTEPPAGIVVLPYARDGIVPTKSTVMLRVDTVERAPQAPMSHRLYTDA